MMLFPRGKGSELFDFSLLEGWPEVAGKVKCGVQAAVPDCVGRISCSLWLIAFQERVDTGTPLFCPVVVASKGSSLNHSA
jgi:hypothetical protein